MTNDQLELLSDMIVDKLYAQLRPLLKIMTILLHLKKCHQI